jgi:type I site-specific restriction endonuclease
MWKKNKSNTAVMEVEAVSDIRARMNQTLTELQKAIEETTKRRNTQLQVLDRWTARKERIKVIIEQTPEEGRAAAEMLLEQAVSHAETHQRVLSDETEHLALLNEQHRSLEESVNRLDAVNRVKVLQERIKSINTSAPKPLSKGDDEKTVFDQREIEKNIHMINALIELKKDS